jgi:hypothetical protein
VITSAAQHWFKPDPMVGRGSHDSDAANALAFFLLPPAIAAYLTLVLIF